MQFFQFYQWCEKQTFHYQQCLAAVQNQCRAEKTEMQLRLNKAIEAKNEQALLFKIAKEMEIKARAENEKLIDENKVLSSALDAVKVEMAEMKTQGNQLASVSQELLVQHEQNALQENNIKELKKLKESYSMLNAEHCQLKLELDIQIGKIDALNAVNEMLLKGNEKRDESIAKYKKKLQNFVKLSSSSDSETQIEQFPSLRRSIASQPFEMQQKRGSGRKALHALSLLGAENTRGPWLCLRCGAIDSPIYLPSYAEFRQHLIHVHKENIDPALCEHCGWRSGSDRELDLHKYKVHQIESLFYRFSKVAILDKFKKA